MAFLMFMSLVSAMAIVPTLSATSEVVNDIAYDLDNKQDCIVF